MKLKRHRVNYVPLLPTVVTLGNGICGFLAIVFTMEAIRTPEAAGSIAVFVLPAWLIMGGMVFDALDGKLARMTRTTSKFGGQLDSFCDMITFGLAPSMIIFAIQLKSGFKVFPFDVTVVLCVFYTICAIVRLARFNIEVPADEKFHQYFSGLPTPAAAGVVASTILSWSTKVPSGNTLDQLLGQWNVQINLFLLILALLLGLLMVSRIRYIHVVNRIFRGFRPFVHFVEIALAVMLMVLFKEFSLFFCFMVYMMLGPLGWIKTALFRKDVPESAPEERESLF